jgi:hypothetical protein
MRMKRWRYILVAVLILVAARATAGPDYFRPGRWVALPRGVTGRITAPGTATVVGPDASGVQYALPMAAPWHTGAGGAPKDVEALPRGAWLVAEIDRLAGVRTVPRDAVLKALPDGSALVPLGDIQYGVPDSVDAVIAYDFGESRLQPDERAALARFVKQGGAVFFVYAARSIPAASVGLWRELFGAQGEPERQAPGLPRGLLVPEAFRLGLDFEVPGLVWKRYGRGLTLAYALPPRLTTERLTPEMTEQLLEQAGVVFARARHWIESRRRPIVTEPFMPDLFRLFGPVEWGCAERRRIVLTAAGYAVAAVALLFSFRGLLARKKRRWLGAALAVALGGVVAIYLPAVSASGLALDVAPVVIDDPEAGPVMVLLGRVARLGPGQAPQIRSMTSMPPKLVLYGRFSAQQKQWANYRFEPPGPSLEPLLDIGQNLCLVSVRPLTQAEASAIAAQEHPGPPEADARIGLARKRWAEPHRTYRFEWKAPTTAHRMFDPRQDDAFVQIRRRPVLWMTASSVADRPAP